MYAVRAGGNLDMIKYLVEHHADVNATTKVINLRSTIFYHNIMIVIERKISFPESLRFKDLCILN